MSGTRNAIAAAITAATLAFTASPAFARGGGGGGVGGGGGSTPPTTQPAPAPDPVPWALCPEYATGSIVNLDGTTLFANEIAGVGCMVVRVSGSTLTIAEVRVAAGWLYSIKSSDASKLMVDFTNPTTNESH